MVGRAAISERTGRSRRSLPAPASKSPGRLIVVGVQAAIGIEPLFEALARRLGGRRGIVFPRLVVTGPCRGRGHELAVSRRLFNALAAERRLAVLWDEAGRQAAIPADVRDDIEQGLTAIVLAPLSILHDARIACGAVTALRVGGERDAAQRALTPEACLGRTLPPALAWPQAHLAGSDATIDICARHGPGACLAALTLAVEGLVRMAPVGAGQSRSAGSCPRAAAR